MGDCFESVERGFGCPTGSKLEAPRKAGVCVKDKQDCVVSSLALGKGQVVHDK